MLRKQSVESVKSILLWIWVMVLIAGSVLGAPIKGLLVVFDGRTLRQNAPAYEYSDFVNSRGGFKITLSDGSIVTGMAGSIVARLEYQTQDANSFISDAEAIAREYVKAAPILELRIERFKKAAAIDQAGTESGGVKRIADIAMSPKTEDLEVLTGALSSEDLEAKKWAIRGLGKLNDQNAFQRLDDYYKSGRTTARERGEIIKQYGRMASGPQSDLATRSLDRLVEIFSDKSSGSEVTAKSRVEIVSLIGQNQGWIKSHLESFRSDAMASVLKDLSDADKAKTDAVEKDPIVGDEWASQLNYGLLVKQTPAGWRDGSDGSVAGVFEKGQSVNGFRILRSPIPLEFRCFSAMKGWSKWASVNDPLVFADDDSLEAIQFQFAKGIPTGMRVYGRVRVGNVGWLRTLQIEDQVVLGATSKGWRIEAIQLFSSVGDGGEFLPQWQRAVGVLDRFLPEDQRSAVISGGAPTRMFPDEPGIGRWMWASGNGQTEFWIQANGLAHRPSVREGWERLNTLEYPAYPPTYRMRVNNASAETLTLNWDGSVMSGTNQSSSPICAVRIDGENQLCPGQRPSFDVERKLETLILPNMKFENAPLETVVSVLQKKSVELDRSERDSEKRGIQFRIENPTGLPLGQVTWLKNDASMRYAVDQVALRSGTIARVEVDEVVFVPKGSDAVESSGLGSVVGKAAAKPAGDDPAREASEAIGEDMKTKWMSAALALCGEWKEGNDPNHYFFRANRTTSHWRDNGTWTIESGVMKISWDNGYSADIQLGQGQHDGFDWTSFRPGRRDPTIHRLYRVK